MSTPIVRLSQSTTLYDGKGSGGGGGAAVTNAIYNYLGIGNETVDERGREIEQRTLSLSIGILALVYASCKDMVSRS